MPRLDRRASMVCLRQSLVLIVYCRGVSDWPSPIRLQRGTIFAENYWGDFMSHANVRNVGQSCSTLPKLMVGLLSAFLMLSFSASTRAQEWKSALLTEQANNNTRITQINAQGKPVAAQLRQNTAAVAKHNAQHPNGTCTYPAGHPEVCAPWIREAARLNAEKTRLVGILTPLVAESDRLTARNNEIARRLRCVPLPVACTSNAQCNECSSCSTFDGSGKAGICQPRP